RRGAGPRPQGGDRPPYGGGGGYRDRPPRDDRPGGGYRDQRPGGDRPPYGGGGGGGYREDLGPRDERGPPRGGGGKFGGKPRRDFRRGPE
ncbi:MAG TPA: hypothetical protein VNZ52_09165, partial [Candidatus Thermoplasmatota archaeon]|nr:hypothetical protein [Candidatus Thermoplasmatota archaeon]